MHQVEHAIRPHRDAELYDACAQAAHYACPAGRANTVPLDGPAPPV